MIVSNHPLPCKRARALEFTHFSKPSRKFVEECIYGIQASGDTHLLVDPTEIRKEFSYKMEFVTRVRDASRSSKEGRDVLVNGYHGCMVAACRPGGRKTVPLALKLWSSRSPGFGRETPKTTSRNALQPLSMRVPCISALKKWVNSRNVDTIDMPVRKCHFRLRSCTI